MFIDELEIFVRAGNGGHGACSFRREKYVEFGGPDGGEGGHGGDVVFRVKPEYNTLLPLRNQRHYHAENGKRGGGSNMTGASGRTLVLEVPRGTLVRDRETGTLIGDLTAVDGEVIVARGGRGGKGNKHFASSTLRTPRFSQPGGEGESLWVRLELKILADVGLVGFPNAGKSTLISRISAARPKVAEYPFTTLVPSLGVVKVTREKNFVVADIPGIIEGAHEGAGLGLRFLRHIERTSILLITIDPGDPERDIHSSYRVLLEELRSFSEALSRKKMAVVLTKSDVPHDRQQEIHEFRGLLERDGVPFFEISAVTGTGLQPMVFALHELVVQERQEAWKPPLGASEEEPPLRHKDEETDPLDLV